ncbi:MAG: hypothetical protein EXR93_08000 [Gemmatimonadetes bacterium]|nr:hypothetical protein [Gemmatimonadota bacterium]
MTQRPMTGEERSQLEELLKSALGAAKRLGVAAANTMVVWLVGLVVLVFAWAALAWGVRKMSGQDFGLASWSAPWIACAGALAALVPAIRSSSRWLRSWKDPKALIRADLDAGVVEEEALTFTSARRFQEPEHGGLFYFLRAGKGRAFVVFDHESQDLGVAGKDPLGSSFRPCVDLVVARSPASQLVLAKSFLGEPLDAGIPLRLKAPPDEWPAEDEFCDIPWGELEDRLGAGAASPGRG